ncbi:sushi, von Willebrand factor type A, EGF and pentraxin domain-containing protein 1-like [Hetaerina americana]|uniref:sushi, von Willebrand factor type A, EGF and pentraxin domain-containing protein 1-like n=1 Tax=Hetaerina americana TaxID=62018 RepID=UPI003A7F24DC
MAMHWGSCRFPMLLVTLAMTGFFGDVFGNPMPKHVQQIRATNQTHSSINDPQGGKLDPAARENTHVKSRADILGGTLKRLLRKLKEADDPRLELVFLVDSSASVGAEHFFNEIRFVRKLLSDFTVSNNAVRVALVTFSSRNRVIRHIDHLSPHSSRHKNNKCNLMQEEFPRITYTGGGTYTLGAMLEAEAILRHARRGVRRAVFLITDGYSNGGDPRPVAQRLKEMRSSRGSRRNHEDGADKEEGSDGRKSSKNNQHGVEIFTFGIKNGNTEELLAMATDKEHTFIVGSFKEFEALGRRAFHQDLQTGSFLPVNATLCNNLCTLGNYTNGSGDSHQNHCCDIMGECACGTVSGHYSCICPPGHYGTGLINDCHPCPMGTYNPGGFPGDMHLLCRRCPDPNHITKKTGATSADQCTCGEGYVSSNERPLRCIAITCPPLTPPLNGYFTRMISGKRSGGRRLGRANRERKNGINRRMQSGSRDACPNLTFKSTCGVRCKTGFVLIGSHIRTCGPNGNWTGHDASCVICNPGYVLWGVRDRLEWETNQGKLICGPDGNWELTTTEIASTKEALAWQRGKWNGGRCVDMQPPTVHACETPPPFILPSEPITQSLEPKSSMAVMAHGLTWDKPVFEDNSGDDVSVQVKAQISGRAEALVWQGIDGGQGEVFPVGDTTIQYTAFDSHGNNNTCEITITIKEHACPEFPGPINGNSNCSRGRKKDSTSFLCTLTCSDGYAFPVSTPQEYFCSSTTDTTARKTISTNQFKLEQGPIHDLLSHDSLNAAMAFHEDNNAEFISWEPRDLLPFSDCMVAAIPNTLQQDGLIFMDGDNSICSDSVSFQQVEDTIRKEISEKLAEICGTGSTGLQCEIVGDIEKVCDNFPPTPEKEERGEERRRGGKRRDQKGGRREGKRKNAGEGGGGRRDGEEQPRRTKTPAGTKAPPVFSATEVLPHINRTRRSVNEDSTEPDSFESSTRDGEKRDDEDDYEYEESEESDNQGKSQGIGIYFKMVGKLANGTQKNQMGNMTALRSLMEKVQQTLEKAVNRGDFDIKVPIAINASSDRESTMVMKELTSSIGFDDPQNGCDKGSAMVNDLCVKCPPGTYWDDFNEDCVVCEKGSYQPLEGQSFCHRCPDGYSTNFGIRSRNRRKAISIKDCIAECKPGTHSVDGLLPCSTCPKGYYTPQRGSLNCTKCPENKTTTARGATKEDECKDVCHSGTVSETGATPCYACPSGYFQNSPGKTFCVKGSCIDENCAENSSSVAKLIKDGEDGHEEILPFNDCFTLPCVNGGTCITLANSGVFCSCAAGFMGSFCESQEDMCASEPCLNDGECSSNGITFHCSCPKGFTGLNCETMTDPCSSNFCLNNGICVANDTSFECLCHADFEGIYCEREVCHSPPCNLNDSCVFNGEDWECMCGDDSSEDECTAEEVQRLEAQMLAEIEEPIDILPNSVLHFPKSSTNNYILVTGNMDKNYTRVTLCGWINTKDRSNYGTVFSLATQDSANAFVLTDYSGFVLYVGGNSAVTDVSANDGKWHHFCLTWASQNGKWQLFFDGILAANGENLSSNYAISGQSTIVIGQEQDWIGGGFSETESFVGRMAMITLENNIITPEEAFQRAALCKSGDRRFLIWDWADFLAEIHGNIEVESSNLCQKCTTPSPPKNGKVVLLENENNSIEDGTNGGLIIKYICHTGFTISKGHEMRWCLSNGTWDGKQPSCKRASCEALEVDLQTEANKVIDSTLSIKCKGRKKANEFKEVNKTDGDGQFHNQNGNIDGGPSYIEETSPSITNETFLTENTNDSSITQDKKETDLDTEDSVASSEDTVISEIKTKCLGPFGIGKLNNDWTSYSEAHNLLNGQENNYSNQKQFLFTYGTKLDISCDFGFELNGANHIVCSLNGLWRKRTNYAASDINDTISHREKSLEEGEIVSVPSCNPVKCGSPPDIHQGEWELMERKRWNKGEGLKWQRVSGGLGYEEIDVPNTFPNTSKDINQPSNPEYAEEEFKFGDVAEYDCEYGYALIGPQSLHCSGDGSWTWSNRNSRWPGLEYAPRYYPPHKWPHNNDNPHAQQPKNKAPRPPVCLPVRCPTPPPPLNGGFVYRKDTTKPRARNNHSDNSEPSEAYYVGEEVLNTCKDEDQLFKASLKRRQLVGPRLRRCLPSGQWSSYRPRCRDL